MIYAAAGAGALACICCCIFGYWYTREEQGEKDVKHLSTELGWKTTTNTSAPIDKFNPPIAMNSSSNFETYKPANSYNFGEEGETSTRQPGSSGLPRSPGLPKTAPPPPPAPPTVPEVDYYYTTADGTQIGPVSFSALSEYCET
eukprot:UN24390